MNVWDTLEWIAGHAVDLSSVLSPFLVLDAFVSNVWPRARAWFWKSARANFAASVRTSRAIAQSFARVLTDTARAFLSSFAGWLKSFFSQVLAGVVAGLIVLFGVPYIEQEFDVDLQDVVQCGLFNVRACERAEAGLGEAGGLIPPPALDATPDTDTDMPPSSRPAPSLAPSPALVDLPTLKDPPQRALSRPEPVPALPAPAPPSASPDFTEAFEIFEGELSQVDKYPEVYGLDQPKSVEPLREPGSESAQGPVGEPDDLFDLLKGVADAAGEPTEEPVIEPGC